MKSQVGNALAYGRRNVNFCTQLKAGRVSELRNKFCKVENIVEVPFLLVFLRNDHSEATEHVLLNIFILVRAVWCGTYCPRGENCFDYYILISWFSDPGFDPILFGASH